MASETQIQVITGMVHELLQNDPDCFLVDLWIKPTNNIRVALDADAGLPIEKCVSLNRKLYKLIEEAAMYPEGDFSLEVSSPGVEEPLKLHRQYSKNIGRTVEVTLNDGTKKEGKLTGVNDDDFVIEEKSGQGKKTVSQTTNILFNQVRHTKVLITF